MALPSDSAGEGPCSLMAPVCTTVASLGLRSAGAHPPAGGKSPPEASRRVWSGVPVLLAAEGPARLRALWSTLGMTSVWGILPTFNGGSWAPDIPGQQDGGAETLLPT